MVKAIILSNDFTKRNPKVQQPLAMMTSFVRATGLEFTPTEGLVNQLAACGQRLFGWPTPNGFPDDDHYLISANALRQRWSLMLGLGHNTWNNGLIPINLLEKINAVTPTTAASHWINSLTGGSEATALAAVINSLSWSPDQAVAPVGPERQKRLAHIAACCALLPTFQVA